MVYTSNVEPETSTAVLKGLVKHLANALKNTLKETGQEVVRLAQRLRIATLIQKNPWSLTTVHK